MARNVAEYQRIFLETRGEGPWPCRTCGELVYEFGKQRGLGNVHHLDGDHTNNHPDNLDIVHHECHAAEHPLTDQAKQRISRALRGRPSPTFGTTWTPERRARQVPQLRGSGNPFFGRTHTAETRQKMRQPRRRLTCRDCGREFAINWITRHKEAGLCSS